MLHHLQLLAVELVSFRLQFVSVGEESERRWFVFSMVIWPVEVLAVSS